MNACLGMLKIAFGYWGHSQALMADGVHSLGDLLTDLAVLLAAKAHSQGPDSAHPYGHGRIETAATAAISVFLLFIGSMIIYQAIEALLFHHFEALPSYSVMIIAVISMLGNEIFFQWTVRVGRKVKSDLLIANAWHHRSDSLSSLVVLIGVAALYFLHLPWADRVAAIFVGLLIVKMAISMSWASICELVDTGADLATTEAIRQCIQKTSGVVAVHMLRTRMLAQEMFVDVHIQIEPHLSASEGHYIGDLVIHHLKQRLPNISDVTVHVDIEDDQAMHPDYVFLTRPTIERRLQAACADLPLWRDPPALILHYLEGQLHVELLLLAPGSYSGRDCEVLVAKYQERISDLKIAQSLRVFFEFL